MVLKRWKRSIRPVEECPQTGDMVTSVVWWPAYIGDVGRFFCAISVVRPADVSTETVGGVHAPHESAFVSRNRRYTHDPELLTQKTDYYIGRVLK